MTNDTCDGEMTVGLAVMISGLLGDQHPRKKCTAEQKMASAAWVVRQSAALLLNQESRLRHRHHGGTSGEAVAKGPPDEETEKGNIQMRRSFIERAQSATCRKRRWMLVALFLSFPILIMNLLLHNNLIRKYYFGDGDSMEGGQWGAKIDRRNRRWHRRQIEQKRKSRLKELGIIDIPPLDNVRNEQYLTITSEILGKRVERKRQLQEAEQFVNKRQAHCQSAPHDDDSLLSGIPPHILQANYGAWFRPREGTSMPIIPFEEHDIRVFVSEAFPKLMPLYDKSHVEEQLLLWSLCALYKYGGHVFGSRESHVGWLVEEIMKTRHSCQHIAVARFQKGADHKLHLLMLASSPRHPQLKCAIHKLEMAENATSVDYIVESLFSPESWKSSTVRMAVENNDNMPMLLDTMCSQCAARQPSACCDIKLNTCEKLESTDKEGKIEAWTFVGVHPRRQWRIREETKEIRDSSSSPRTEVTISERTDTPAPLLHPKFSIRETMKASKCGAGWLCHRCLHNPVYGTYESCSSVCKNCFIDLICNNDKDEQLRTEIVFDVMVRGAGNLRRGEQRIPRVVHQTWLEEISVDRYPQLSRVQSSWKNAGWEYRFYTDNDARDYIARNFPSRFLNAYDSLVPGAFKADLFRCLVLLKDGGIYADADVLLGTNLDVFITRSMSFFVPLDLVGADYDEEFCLWNGLIGAAPGHPIIIEAVEWLINMVLNRADAYDFERQLCRYGGKTTEVWKVRQGRLLLLSGPCALGVAANRALGKSNPVARIESGWLSGNGEKIMGDSLVLRGDKFDMNAFRFTDVDRNTIVASTDMIDLTTTPLDPQTNLRKPSHYSETEALDDVFGSKGVYVDKLVTNELIKLNVSYQN